MSKKIFVLDTNILIHEPSAFYSFDEHDIVIPMTVIEELDRVKDKKVTASQEARQAIKSLEKVFKDADADLIKAGVQLEVVNGRDKGKISVFNEASIVKEEMDIILSDFGGFYVNNDGADPDFAIMKVALYLQQKTPERQVILVTKDINMRLRSKSMGIQHVEDFKSDCLIDDIDFLAKGYEHIEGCFWEKLKNESVDTFSRDGKTAHEFSREAIEEPYLNQYIIDETDKFAGKIVEINDDKIIMEERGKNKLMSKQAWGIKPRNLCQGMALDALLDPEMSLVSLTGSAGSGKTLLALAAALQLVVEDKKYDKIIVTRSTPEIAESIGFLPGTEEEKMAPWLAAISDSLEALHKDDEDKEGTIKYLMDKYPIQYKSINFIRGRSIQNAVVILDEGANVTPNQMKTIVTRIAESSKLFAIGNLGQIDSYVTANSSGLTYLVEKMKNFDGAATVTLQGGQRGRLAAFAEENM